MPPIVSNHTRKGQKKQQKNNKGLTRHLAQTGDTQRYCLVLMIYAYAFIPRKIFMSNKQKFIDFGMRRRLSNSDSRT